MPGGRWVLGWRTAAGYGLALLAILVAGVAGTWQVREARQAGEFWFRAQRGLHDIDRLALGLVDAETAKRGYLLTADPSYLPAFEAGIATTTATLADLRQALEAEPGERPALERLTGLVRDKVGELRAAVELRRAGNAAAALEVVRVDQSRQTMANIRALLAELEAGEARRVERREAQRNARFANAGRVVVAGSGLAVAVLVAATLALNALGRGRLRAERRLRESEERLRVTLRSIGDAVIATDPAGRVVFMNTVAEQLTGWTQAEAAGQPLEEVFRIVNEESRAPVESPVAKVMRLGVVVGLANHTVLLGRHGVETPIDDSGAPIRDAGGEIMGVVLVFRDVTERQAAERQIERLALERAARHAAERASAAKDEFLAVLSHELRSPLQGIIGWLGVLRAGRADPTQERALQAIERGVRQQAQLVGDLLDASRVVAGKLQVEHAPVDPAALVRDCVDEIQPAANDKGVTLRVDVAECGTVMGDVRRLHQSVGNLLGNAVKFTPAGGRIDVSCQRRDGRVAIIVRDTGEGIDPQFLPHLFDRFSQAVVRRAHPTSGLGLGLSIVRQIIDLHGGTIQAASAGLGHGATFEISLPAAAEAGVPAPRAAQADRRSLAGLSLLLVDDDADTRESLGLLLAARGAEVRTADSVAAALDACAGHPPQVVVSDIGLPGEDGYALATALRGLAAPPIAIALSGYAAADDRRQAAAAGFDAHVAKPVDLDELTAVILEQRARRAPT